MSVLRRRLMMQGAAQEEWDFAWDYMSGLAPDDAGMEKYISSEGSASGVLTEYGYLITAKNSSYIRLVPPQKTMETGVVSIDVVFKSFHDGADKGFRLLLSNGTNGAQVYANYGDALRYNYGSNTTTLCKLYKDTDYNINLQLNNNGENVVYLNESEILRTKTLSTSYCTENRIFQQAGGSTLIKSIKYKFGRV